MKLNGHFGSLVLVERCASTQIFVLCTAHNNLQYLQCFLVARICVFRSSLSYLLFIYLYYQSIVRNKQY